MTIARRVTLSFALMVLLVGLNLIVYFWASQQKSDSLAELRSTSDRRMLLRALEHDLRDRHRESAILSEAVLDGDQLTALEQRLDALTGRTRDVAAAHALAPADTDLLRVALARFAEQARAVFRAAAAGRRAEAREAKAHADETASAALAASDRIARREEGRAGLATERFFAITMLTHQVSLVTFGLSLLITVAVGSSMTWYIRRGFARLVGGAERIAQGDLAHRVESTTDDELGALAAAFNNMTARLAQALTQASDARAAAERASRAKGAFLANMSHEFRTPLTSILCYADLLKQEATRTGQTRLAQDAADMRLAADHLVALVNQVVDLARIESGRLAVTLEEIEVPPFITHLGRTVQPLAEQNGNTLQLDVAEEVGEMVVDALKLRQILLNLLANACKFTSHGTVRLVVDASTLDGGVAAIRFRVIDTGIGMTPEQAARIFEEFEQGDPSIERGYGGSGLGLTISRGLATLLGGTIEVGSVPGAGATFTVVLPAHAVIDEAPVAPGEPRVSHTDAAA
jgi:signal transduction histidine kinase